MPKISFLDKFLERIERIDRKDIVHLFSQMVQEHGLLEIIFNALQEGVIVTDSSLSIIFNNNRVSDLLQISQDAFSGKMLADFFTSQGLDEIAKDIRDNQNQWLNKEIELPTHRFLRINTMPVYNKEGDFLAYIVFIVDITKDRVKERENIKLEKMAILQSIAAGLAHEIGNPLNSIDIHLQLAERSLKDEKPHSEVELTDSIGVIKSEIRRLDRIISNFLNAVRPVKPEYELTNLNTLLLEVSRFMEPELQSLNIDLIMKLDESLPETLLDKNQMKQVFSNIIKNAIQAMPQGGNLAIITKKDTSDIRLEFTDTGEGISPELIKRIFEPYVTSKQNGSGLGLMIIEKIIHEHGGSIGVKSLPGQGTTFTVTIPLVIQRKVRMLPEHSTNTNSTITK